MGLLPTLPTMATSVPKASEILSGTAGSPDLDFRGSHSIFRTLLDSWVTTFPWNLFHKEAFNTDSLSLLGKAGSAFKFCTNPSVREDSTQVALGRVQECSGGGDKGP